jgi:hypothetical protein
MKFHEPDLRGPSLEELKSRNQAAGEEARGAEGQPARGAGAPAAAAAPLLVR